MTPSDLASSEGLDGMKVDIVKPRGLKIRSQPDVFNGYSYFYVRLYCTCLGFQANIVEEYVLL